MQYGHWIYNKGYPAFSGERIVFAINYVGSVGYPQGRK